MDFDDLWLLTYENVFFTILPKLCVCVCVCVCVCACVCVFIFFHRKDFFWLNKTMNVMPEVQVSDGMLRKNFCVKYLCRHVKYNHSKNLKAKECQLNRA